MVTTYRAVLIGNRLEWHSEEPKNLPDHRVEVLVTILEERVPRGSREKFEAALTSFPDVEPAEYDKL
jgi:hypothetical protein